MASKPEPLPFKITAQSVGAQKAYRAMVRQYGLEKGRQVFIAKAVENGRGKTITAKVNSTYMTGAKLPKKEAK